MSEPLRVFIVAGEESGDRLGASLVADLQDRLGEQVTFAGVGGEAMGRLGFQSVFPVSDIAVMGLSAVIGRLPTILKRLKQTVSAVLAFRPDVLVVIDSPDFSHRVAKRVRQAQPDLPIVGWVSPSVWAWRPARAARMRSYIDHLLAILPFEPETHRVLGGPACSYVGHPVMNRLHHLYPPHEDERPALDKVDRPHLLVLPGSRRGEITRHLDLFRHTLEELQALGLTPRIVIPAVDHLAGEIRQKVAEWPFQAEVVSGQAGRDQAFRDAHAALAVSGTVALELAMARVPMTIVYKLDWLARLVRPFIRTWTIVLPNFILQRPAIREYVDEMARANVLARAVASLLTDTPERRAQLASFAELHGLMADGGGKKAEPADIVLDLVQQKRGV
ncbi:lipid-A-disaccharide synthase [Coralliovum pocilloporae]|uniref:lipid-A-disaccharide synthase n=1 Tax=Coralliovum pocilloporae TaxID=3066369 RepID=UPI003306A396